MVRNIGDTDIRLFRDVLSRRMGLSPQGVDPASLAPVLRRRLAARGMCCGQYLSELVANRLPNEVGALAEAVTVGETYFYRHAEQFSVLAEVVLPERLGARAGMRRLTILSAGCASGEEPYTAAIVARQALPYPSREVAIVGVDVNPAALDRARRGRYSGWALRATPPDVRRRWFRADGDAMLLDGSVRRCVSFVEHNLAEDDPTVWAPKTYDAIFCRNVMMYMTPQARRALMARICRALAPGGCLFLGPAETGFGRVAELDLCESHRTFYHRRREADAETAAGTAAGRIPTPGRQRRAAPAPGAHKGMPGDGHSPEALTARAIALAQEGHLGAAEEVCRRLLDLDALNAAAYHILALCREGLGDRAAAMSHYRTAAYLDPGFALPRLRLGEMARRLGDDEGARRDLGHAMALLPHEDSRRVMLFGGGFGRQALMDLCRAQLVACGGTP